MILRLRVGTVLDSRWSIL